MAKSPNWNKYPVLFSLYIAQSIPMSFFSTVVPVIMRQERYSLESIGLLQLMKLPWIIKFLWAPIVDNSSHSRRQLRNWILASEFFYAAVVLSIGFFNLETDFRLIVILMVLAFIASATQDIATDIFAIRILLPEERSFGNSMQSTGSFIGSLLGTGLLLIAYYYFGWQILLLMLALFVCFAVIPMLLYRKPLPEPPARRERVTLLDIFKFLMQKGMHKRVILLLLFYSGIIGILAMMKPYLVDLGYNVAQIGIMSGIFGTSLAAASAFLAGFIIRKAGKKKSMLLFLGTGLTGGLLFTFMTGLVAPPLWLIYAGIGCIWSAYGMSSVAVYTISMDIVRPGREGTDFTLQIVLTHLSSLIIAVSSGKIADMIHYRGLFSIEAGLSLFTILFLLMTWKDEDKV